MTWKIESIREEQRGLWAEATADWSADELREKLVEVVTAIYPIEYVLSHLLANPKVPHGGMTVISDLFLETFGHDTPEGFEEGCWAMAYDSEKKTHVPVAVKWDSERPEKMETQEASFVAGQTLDHSFRVLSIWQYATAASINCGSFGTEEIALLGKAIRRDRPTPPTKGTTP